MPRYFIEVAYKGTRFNGFQLQPGKETIQGHINSAFTTLLGKEIQSSTSSRTDSGVHALQNFLHIDLEEEFHLQRIYNLNALLPRDILIKQVYETQADSHARFHALSRKYTYYILGSRDPFRQETAYYMPFKTDHELMQEGAALLRNYSDFESFSKKKTDVKTFTCTLSRSEFLFGSNDNMEYHVEGNRFLRGMVRALTGTLLQLGRKKISLKQFEDIILSRDCKRADFSVPAHGLFLEQVRFPSSVFKNNKPAGT